MKLYLLITLSLYALISQAQTFPSQDCVGAIQLCTGQYEETRSPYGLGSIDELSGFYNANPNFCLLNGENNSLWYKVKFGSSGIFVFSIEPNSQNDDFDFALFDLTGGSCQDIIDNTARFLRCSYSLSSGMPIGLAVGSTGTSSSANGSAFLAPVQVNAGDELYLLVDNFTRNSQGFTIDFTGTTATMVAADSFYIADAYGTILPNSVVVDVYFSQMIDCGSLSTDYSEFTVTDDYGDILDVLSVACNNLSNHITISVASSTSVITYATVSYQNGTDGNIVVSGCGDNLRARTEIYVLRNAEGLLDFTQAQSGNRFTFTPIVHSTASITWYINDTAFAPNYNGDKYRSWFNLYQPYEVCLEADYGYLKDSVCKSYYITGIADLAAYDAFTIYPNPAQSEVTITLPYGAETIEVMDISGKLIESFEGIATGQTVTFNTAAVPQGLYLIKVTHAKGIATQKLQVLH